MNRRLWLATFGALCFGCLTTAEVFAGEPIQGAAEKAADVTEAYASAWLIGDGSRMASLLDQNWVHAKGGGRAVREELEQRAVNLRRLTVMPLRVTLGAPQMVSTNQFLYVFVPVRSVAQGFPHEVESRGYFAAISRDNGKTWGSLDTACAENVRRVFKDYPIKEVAKLLTMNFDPSRTIVNPNAQAVAKTVPRETTDF